MSEYVITIEDWFFKYAHERYTHFFGCPIEEIVRCRDCVEYEPYHTYAGMKLDYGKCMKHERETNDDRFCWWGERRTNDD